MSETAETPAAIRPSFYNLIAGHDLGRIAALSDGIFGVAMTLLFLDVRLPEAPEISSEQALIAALGALAPKFLTWLLSAMTVGIFWLGQATQLDNLERSDRNLCWLHFAFLAVVTALPFSTRLLADFFTYRTAFAIYWANIMLCGATLYVCWAYSERAGLAKRPYTPELGNAMRKRIVYAQTLYGIGMLIGLISPPFGVLVIIAIQLNYALGLKLPARFAH